MPVAAYSDLLYSFATVEGALSFILIIIFLVVSYFVTNSKFTEMTNMNTSPFFA